MPLVTLTDLTVKNLKPVPGKRVTYLDKSLKGFGVMVMPSGHAVYTYTFGPNRQRVRLGTVGVVKLAAARLAAKNLAAERQLGRHSHARSPAYKTALDEFLALKAQKLKPRTIRDYTRLLTRHGFGLEKLEDVSPRDIHRKLDKLAPSERAHAHVALAIFMRWCFKRHYLDRNPMERMDKPSGGSRRTRILSDDEIRAAWPACQDVFGDIWQFCLLTGQRRSEIAQLQWPWIKDDLVTFPPELTKNKIEHTFPIGAMAKAIIDRQPRRNDTPYLFPARAWGRGKKAQFYGSWSRDKAALDKASGVTNYVIHDLRRTMRSRWAELGILREVAEKYINHISGAHSGVAGIYDRFKYLEPMRQAVQAWEDHLQSVLARP